MGYTLKIGEAIIDWNEERVRIGCELISRSDAPAFGEPTDYENQRWPSYTAWAEAMRSLGLDSLMSEEVQVGEGVFLSPLLAKHPGAAPITQGHVDYVAQKLAAYKQQHPDHVAQYPPLKPGAKPMAPDGTLYSSDQYVDDPRYDSALCRGEWLLYWMRWAVENCKHPVFVNT